MAKYSIKDLERFSGIKAHTLRIWEKRYDLLNPDRTDTNIRYYTDEDLKRLLNVSILSNSGMKISQIAELSKDAIAKTVMELEDENVQNQKRVNQLVTSMVDLDEDMFRAVFDQLVLELGFEKTLNEVVYPFLEKVGILWLSDEIQPSHEHFTTHLIRSRIIYAIEQLPPTNGKKKAILFLPEGEYHELGLIYFHYLLKKKGIKVYYLGQSVPSDQVKELSRIVNPNWVISYSIIKKKKEIEEFLNEMGEFTSDETFFLENKYQTNMGIVYPTTVVRSIDKEDLLQKVG